MSILFMASNGQNLDSRGDYTAATAHSVPQLNPDQNVFAVNGVNTGGPAGVIGTILVAYNEGTSVPYVTDMITPANRSLEYRADLSSQRRMMILGRM